MALIKRGMFRNVFNDFFLSFNLLTHLYEIPERFGPSKYPAARVLLNMYAAGLVKEKWKCVGVCLLKMLFLVKHNKISVCVNHRTLKSPQKPGKKK